MAQFSGFQGLEAFCADQQGARSNTVDIYDRLGRKPSAVPSHMSRFLYIPWHGSAETHLPLYEISGEYQRRIGDAPIGSSRYTAGLCMLDKPAGDGTGGDVQYLADFKMSNAKDYQAVSAKVQRRALGATPEVELCLAKTDANTATEGSFSIKLASTNPFFANVPVLTSYPIPDTTTQAGTARHPYFSFSLPTDTSTVFQWQIHPLRHGALRYTLVAVDLRPGAAQPTENASSSAADAAENPDQIIAIYHHTGLATNLFMGHSEGVLLLPAEGSHDATLEAVIVASLLGLLWRLRGNMVPKLNAKGRRQSGSIGGNAESAGKRSIVSKIFRKNSA